MATTINPSNQTITQFAIQIGGASNVLAGVAIGSTAQFLQANTGAAPTWSTATLPSTASGTGTILRADGTNWSATTTTYPNTNAINTILYASSANVMSALATANTAVLATNGSGVPSLTATPTVTSITFGAGSALNTYVQATSFTPALAFGGSATGITYSTQQGEYTQIGNIIFFAVSLILTSKGAQTGNTTITGFPVAAGGTLPYTSMNYCVGMTLTGNVSGQVNSTTMSLIQSTSGVIGNVTNTAFANTSQMIFQGFYFTS